MNWLDILLIAFLLFSAFQGYLTGLVQQVIRVVGILAAYWAAKVYSPTVAPWVASLMGKSPVSSSEGAGSLTEIGNSLVQPFVNTGYGIVSFVVVFFVVLVAVRLIGSMINLVFSLPGLSFVNRISGLALGLIFAVLILVILVNLFTYFPSPAVQETLKASKVAEIIRQAEIGSFLRFT